MRDKPNKIITHDGIFHADEVIGIALVQHYFCTSIPVIRTREEKIIEKAKKDPSIWLIDVGMELNPKLGNLDHHQDIKLLGATIHVANKLWSKIPSKFERLVKTVSQWDVNANNIHDNTPQGGCISQFFKTLNNHGSFEDALEFARKLLFVEDEGSGIFTVPDAYLVDGVKDKWESMLAEEVLMEAEWEQLYKDSETYFIGHGNVIILPKFFPWARFAKSSNESAETWQSSIVGAIFYDDRAGNWRLSSIDSKNMPLSDSCKVPGFIFMHPARFIAGFETLDAAKLAARLWSI